jgi:hypothetical protein
MKHLFVTLCSIILAVIVYAQQPVPAAPGVNYGAEFKGDGAIPINELDKKMVADKFDGKLNGKVVEVCQEKGCWMKLEKANGEKLMVKFKDYAYFMPKNIVGKEVVLDGEARVNEISVKQLRHYAKDAGKSKEEIEKITEPRKEVVFVARGVKVL